MNLYDLHSNPKELYGFDIAPYKLPWLAYDLAMKNSKLRPKLEPAIMKDPEWAYEYALYVLERPWPEAEPVIMKDPKYAYLYARDVIRRRWPEAEQYIMENSRCACLYARYVLKRRWPEAEPYIMKDLGWWNDYKRHFNL